MSSTAAKKLKSNEERLAFLNTKVQEEQEAQEMELVKDFDRAFAEHKAKNKPHKIRFLGRIFEVPRSVPFAWAAFCARHCYVRKQGNLLFVVPEEKLVEYYSLMFGREFVEAMEEANVDNNFVLLNIVPEIMSLWGLDVVTGEAKNQKNVKTPGN